MNQDDVTSRWIRMAISKLTLFGLITIIVIGLVVYLLLKSVHLIRDYMTAQ